MSLEAVNQILCRSWGYELLQKSQDSLKACLENVNIHTGQGIILEVNMTENYKGIIYIKCSPFVFVCLIWFFTSQSTIFQLYRDASSWCESVLSKDKCDLLKDRLQWRRWGSNLQPFYNPGTILQRNNRKMTIYGNLPIIPLQNSMASKIWESQYNHVIYPNLCYTALPKINERNCSNLFFWISTIFFLLFLDSTVPIKKLLKFRLYACTGWWKRYLIQCFWAYFWLF